MKLSVSSYSFQSAIKKGTMTQFDTVAAAHQLGFHAIEFINLAPEFGKTPTLAEQKDFARRLKAEAARLGMTINAYTIGADLYCKGEAAEREINRLKDQLDVAAILGVSVLRHDVCYSLKKEGEGRGFDGMIATLAANIRRVTEYAATLGIKTCSENHGYIAQDSDRIERLFHAVHHDNYGLLVDFGNFACVDEDSAMAVSRLAPYAIHVHAKDFVKHPFREHFEGGLLTRGCNHLVGCAIGEGDIPVEQCVAIMKRAGYDGFLSIEYEGSEDPFIGIAKGRDALLSYGVEA